MAIGLSMDAFSLSLAYGTNKISKNKIILLSLVVGLFHFFMPITGSIIGEPLSKLISKADIVVGIIFIILAIEMFTSKDEENKIKITNIISIIVFAFTVSIDSFTVGIGLSLTNKDIIIPSIIFSITSFIFTLLGLILGKKISKTFGTKAIYLGILILLVLGIKYLL